MAGNPAFPDAVQFVIAQFRELFGTALGNKVQAWCNKWGWSLVWALGPTYPGRWKRVCIACPWRPYLNVLGHTDGLYPALCKGFQRGGVNARTTSDVSRLFSTIVLC